MKQHKRLFIACSIQADWPQQFPPGKLLSVDNRHMTFAFLGMVDEEKIALLNDIPKVKFTHQPEGLFDKILALPKRRPRAMTYHACFTCEADVIIDYQQRLVGWLRAHEFKTDSRPFLPHVTIARPPFKPGQWKHTFKPFPFRITGVHLYESLGNRQYKKLLTFS